MLLSTLTIKNNYRATKIADLDVDGLVGDISIKPKGTGRTGMVNVSIKVGKEKRSTVFSMADNASIYDLPGILEDYFNLEFVSRWIYRLEDHIPA